MLTPFERMKKALEDAGYKIEHQEYDGAEGYFVETKKVIIYFGYPSGKECYWQLDGKIGVDNREAFNKWSQVPFYVWLPETEDEVKRILDEIKFIGTNEGHKASNEFDNVNWMFGFDIPQRS
jgi:hypothetical protein